jgi:predicted lipoprotein
VNLVVNQLAQTAEQAYDQRLSFPLFLAPPIHDQLDRIKGSRSGTSLQDPIWMLEGVRALYRGAEEGGVDDALRRVNAPLENRLDKQYDATMQAISAIGAPIERALLTNRPALQAAAEQARTFEVMLKVDLASALGVTITFGSGDGD